MKYTLVYREDPQGYNWTVRNTHGLYAATERSGRPPYIRRWSTGAGAHNYMTEYRHRNDPEDLVWAPWPTDKPTPIKPVTTAASYKPTHGGYPDRTALKNVKLAESYGGTYTGRFRSSVGSIEKAAASAAVTALGELIQQPDDGSNEEATTVPDALVAELSECHYVIWWR